MLAAYREAPKWRGPMMRRHATEPEPVSEAMAVFLCDPFAGLPASATNDPTNPMVPPLGWGSYTPDSRERFVAAVIEAGRLAEHAELLRIPHLALAIIRAHHTAPEPYGYPPEFKRYYATDMDERRRWAHAERELFASNSGQAYLLLHLTQKLRASGDLLCALRARRHELDKQIARLEQYQAAFQR
jgi:hypothetical protein